MQQPKANPEVVRLRAIDEARENADILRGDIVLVPFIGDTPDPNTKRYDLDWPDLTITLEDTLRLAVLTEGFHFLSEQIPLGADVATVTWWDEAGDFRHYAISGDPAQREIALALVREATEAHAQIPLARRVLVAANSNPGGATQIAVPVQAGPLIPVIDVTEWSGQDVPEREWYIPDMIPSRNVTLLSGDGGTGKSLSAIQIGIAGALDRPAFSLTPKHGRCLYLGAEDEADEFHRRIDDILRLYGSSYDDLGGRFLLAAMAGKDATLARPDKARTMRPTPLFDALRNRALEFCPDLLVLDTSADLFDGNEIDRVQVRQFVGLLRGLALELDCAVLLLSHPSVAGMQTGTGTSGSTAWNNSVRSRLYLTAPSGEGSDPDARVLSSMKANYGKTGGAIHLRWQDGAFVDVDITKPNPANDLMNRKAEDVFVRLLSMFNRQGQPCSASPSVTYGPKRMEGHPDAEGIKKKVFEQAMHRLLRDGKIKIVEDGPPSKRRSRLWVTAEDFGPAEGAR